MTLDLGKYRDEFLLLRQILAACVGGTERAWEEAVWSRWTESGYEVPLDLENLRIEEDIWILFIFKKLFYWTIGWHFFIFLLKNKNKELLY